MNKLLLIPWVAATVSAAAATPAFDPAQGFTGKVLETTNTAGYTYVRVDAAGQQVWAAGVQTEVKVGDTVTIGSGAVMPQYHSQSMNRDFDAVVFTSSLTVNGAGAAAGTTQLPPGHPALTGGAAAAGLPPGHPSLTKPAAPVKVDLAGIKQADGGQTIAQIYADAAKLAGKTVTVRGKVVKYHAAIMGKNWLHIRDGSGEADDRDNDLAITTAAETKVGDTVLVSGVLTTKKDFGAGYKYAVIIQDAKVTVE
jgi:GW (Gly-Tryp) dipeptide domain